MAEVSGKISQAVKLSAGQRVITWTREMGLGAIFVFAISSISLTYGGMLPLSTAVGAWPGSNLVGALTIALFLTMIHAYTYAMIGVIAPRYGADYLVSSRVLNHQLGFASSWTLVFSLALLGGGVFASLAKDTIPMFAQILSRVTFDSTYVDFLTNVTTSDRVVLIGTVGVALLFLIMILPTRTARRLLAVGVGLALAAWAVIFYQLSASTPTRFFNEWNILVGTGTYQGTIDAAQKAGMRLNGGWNTMILAGLVMGTWIFYGYFHPTAFASEVKNPRQNLLRGSWLALAISWVVMVAAVLFLSKLVPPDWIAAQSYLLQHANNLAMPWIPLYGAVALPIPALVLFVGVVWILAILALGYTLFYTASRILLAWSADNLLPNLVGYQHPDLHSPTVAVFVVCVVAEVGVVNAAFGGIASLHINAVFFMACTQILPVLGLLLLPFRKPEWLARAPRIARLKIGALPLVTVSAAFSLVYLVWCIVSLFLFPAFGGVPAATVMTFLVLFVTGLIWYNGRRAYVIAQGQLFDAQMDSIPEDAVEDTV